MYQLNYFKNKDEDGGYHSQSVDIVYTWIGILFGMIEYMTDMSIKCFEVVDVGENRITDTMENRKLKIHWKRD